MQRNRWSMVWVLTMAVAACGGDDGSGPQTETQTGGARGTVLVGTTGLAGVSVAAAKGSTTRQTTTNGSGQWTFSGLEVGVWTISVTAPNGYALASGEAGTRSVTVVANQTAEVSAMLLAESGGSDSDTTNVVMSGTAFSPATVTIAAGEYVKWTNNDGVQHNATGGNWATPDLSQNASATVHFPTAGTFEYSCTLHANMNGTVVVQ